MKYVVDIIHYNGSGYNYTETFDYVTTESIFTAREWWDGLDEPFALSKNEWIKIEVLFYNEEDDPMFANYIAKSKTSINVKEDDEIRFKVGQTYTSENDATIIWEWTYKGDDLIRERIVGYYHGEPDVDSMKEYAFRGVEGILDLDDKDIFE